MRENKHSKKLAFAVLAAAAAVGLSATAPVDAAEIQTAQGFIFDPVMLLHLLILHIIVLLMVLLLMVQLLASL